MKKCTHCNVTKLETDFEIIKSSGNRRNTCHQCRRLQDKMRYLKNPEMYKERSRQYRIGKELELELKRFSMTLEQYNDMLSKQDHKCLICFEPEKNRRLSIDHDHDCCAGRNSCGKCVRGLLCNNCNNGLGRFKDDAEKLRRAAQYLESFR